uniref:Uncharacterized protein n=1 Tax=Cryptomonas curvata TaxID=233186 RepID=A0A7S0R134_9CRYP
MASSASSSERESLIAAWQALGASQPLCEELQTLCLIHMRRCNGPPRDMATENAAHPETRMFLSSQESSTLLPPQRYTRRARSSNMAPPMGPSKSTGVTDITKPSAIDWTNAAPAPHGPTDGHHDALREEMDQVFHAIHTSH